MSEELNQQDLPTFRKVQVLKDFPHLLGVREGQGGRSTVPRNSSNSGVECFLLPKHFPVCVPPHPETWAGLGW